MRTAIITNAGISSRFNEGIPEDKKVLKAIYSESGPHDTLLYHQLQKCSYADRIVLVGGYKYDELSAFVDNEMRTDFPQIVMVKNDHYADLGSGYSLYVGIKEALKEKTDEILFIEGDLDIDNESFEKVVSASKSVLTITTEPIFANKAVVLYRDANDRYRYAFNSSHGLLAIEEPFSCIFNSGQTWKFTDVDVLRRANEEFYESEKEGTNLGIIRRYVDSVNPDDIEIICLKRWTNCNTRNDYSKIKDYWEGKL